MYDNFTYCQKSEKNNQLKKKKGDKKVYVVFFLVFAYNDLNRFHTQCFTFKITGFSSVEARLDVYLEFEQKIYISANNLDTIITKSLKSKMKKLGLCGRVGRGNERTTKISCLNSR